MITELPVPIVAALIEESLDAVVIIDEASTIRYVNHAMQALTGYGAGELTGQRLEELLPAGLSQGHGAYVTGYLLGADASSVLGKVREFAIRHRTGEMIPVEMKALDLGVACGVRYLGAFMEDLRPRRALEARHNELLARLERQALTDPLTGIPNRRAFESEAARAMARARRGGEALVVGIADIDHFKSVNDRFGHPAGDEVLCSLAKTIRAAARTTDVAARIGGEEFGLVFPAATVAQAAQVAERIRLAVESHPVSTAGGEVIAVTLSIGLAELPAEGHLDEAMARADGALYAAKQNGRNRVEQA